MASGIVKNAIGAIREEGRRDERGRHTALYRGGGTAALLVDLGLPVETER
jgi:hypothetical protein